ncbi:hypothetical protein OKA04_10740 [Luteolibacter flavescens]|uniref:Lipoprotein n=1 Tax=Luteolibacter flavescens TaxID=1859460 RepID=A0ABT3FQF1_9BACT|nr:hypothetical protein [Luteolibacter flavescens]MCW1885205.1 hypothetical protein [Luteolibacter flavescens]
MIARFLSTAVLAASVLLTGCLKPGAEAEKKQAEVKGQVFVVQRNGQTVKLGGVDVHYISREVVEAKCRQIGERIPRLLEVAEYQDNLKYVDVKIEAAYREKPSAGVRAFLSSAKDLQSDAWKRFREPQTLADDLALLAFVEENRDSFEDAGFGRNETDRCALASLITLVKDENVITTQTDADGNYSLSVPAPADGYVFAESSRQLGKDDTEIYYWIQPLTVSLTGPLHLSSPNRFNVHMLDEMIRPVPREKKESGALAIEEEYKLRNPYWFAAAENLLKRIKSNESEVKELRDSVYDVEAAIERAKYEEVGDEAGEDE